MRKSTDLESPLFKERSRPVASFAPRYSNHHRAAGSASNDVNLEIRRSPRATSIRGRSTRLRQMVFAMPRPATGPSRAIELLRARGARHRSFALGGIVAAAIPAAGAIARRAQARHGQRRQAPAMYDALHQLDDRDRSFTLGEIIVAAIQAAGAIARRAYARHRQRRQAMAGYDALRQLNDHTLRDLGFHRSETRSVAEVTREAARTRVRALLTMCGLP